MEFEVTDDTVLHVQGTTVMTLPPYMKRLPPDQFKLVAVCPQRKQMILACGRDKGDVVMLTGDGQLMKLNIAESGLPDEDCLPIDYGHGVLFPQAITGNNTSYEASSRIMIESAKPLNVVFGGEPSYQDEGKTGNASKGNP